MVNGWNEPIASSKFALAAPSVYSATTGSGFFAVQT